MMTQRHEQGVTQENFLNNMQCVFSHKKEEAVSIHVRMFTSVKALIFIKSLHRASRFSNIFFAVQSHHSVLVGQISLKSCNSNFCPYQTYCSYAIMASRRDTVAIRVKEPYLKLSFKAQQSSSKIRSKLLRCTT